MMAPSNYDRFSGVATIAGGVAYVTYTIDNGATQTTGSFQHRMQVAEAQDIQSRVERTKRARAEKVRETKKVVLGPKRARWQ